MFFCGKKKFALFILMSFLSVTFLSFVTMTHGMDGSAPGDCSFSAGAALALCPSNTLNTVVHNVSAYYALLNVPISYGVMIFILSFIFVFGSYVVFLRQVMSIIFEVLHHNLNFKNSSYKRAMNSWLSLLENSPSF